MVDSGEGLVALHQLLFADFVLDIVELLSNTPDTDLSRNCSLWKTFIWKFFLSAPLRDFIKR